MFLCKFEIFFLKIYLIESVEQIYGTTALFFFNLLSIFLTSLIEKLGLAASWINTFLTLNLLTYFNAAKDESDLSFPPVIIFIDLYLFFVY